MTAAAFRRAMARLSSAVLIFGGATLGSIGLYAPMIDAPETAAVRLGLQLCGIAAILAGTVALALESRR